jgi:hypothetical protein
MNSHPNQQHIPQKTSVPRPVALRVFGFSEEKV